MTKVSGIHCALKSLEDFKRMPWALQFTPDPLAVWGLGVRKG